MPQAERKNRTSVESDVFVEGAIHGSFCWRILLAGKRSIAQSACLTLVEAERRAYVGCFLSLDIVERIGMQGLSLDAAERQYIYTSRKASRTCRRRRHSGQPHLSRTAEGAEYPGSATRILSKCSALREFRDFG